MSGEIQPYTSRETVAGLIQCRKALRLPIPPNLQALAQFHGIDPDEIAYSATVEIYTGPELKLKNPTG